MAIPLRQEVEYPESDGQPMAETTLHRKVMNDLIHGFERRYRDTPDVWVGGNLFLYYREGDPRGVVSPDVLVVRGVPKWDRRIFKLWEEGHPPCLVIEVTSAKTRREDLRQKKDCYERLGVEEYVLFDPYSEYLHPRLQGYRLEARPPRRYQPIPLAEDGSLESRTTGVTMRGEGEKLRLLDTATGEPLLWDEEMDERNRALEDENARLRREIERLRASS